MGEGPLTLRSLVRGSRDRGVLTTRQGSGDVDDWYGMVISSPLSWHPSLTSRGHPVRTHRWLMPSRLSENCSSSSTSEVTYKGDDFSTVSQGTSSERYDDVGALALDVLDDF